MNTQTAEPAPVLVMGEANPWNALRYGAKPETEAKPEGVALFPCPAAADGVESRPVIVAEVFGEWAALCVESRTRRETYLPLSRVVLALPGKRAVSKNELQAKRSAYAAELARPKVRPAPAAPEPSRAPWMAEHERRQEEIAA